MQRMLVEAGNPFAALQAGAQDPGDMPTEIAPRLRVGTSRAPAQLERRYTHLGQQGLATIAHSTVPVTSQRSDARHHSVVGGRACRSHAPHDKRRNVEFMVCTKHQGRCQRATSLLSARRPGALQNPIERHCTRSGESGGSAKHGLQEARTALRHAVVARVSRIQILRRCESQEHLKAHSWMSRLQGFEG
jgi:hypothetical protein